jgi:hypothetical protein
MGNETGDMGLPRARENAVGGQGEIGRMPWVLHLGHKKRGLCMCLVAYNCKFAG